MEYIKQNPFLTLFKIIHIILILIFNLLINNKISRKHHSFEFHILIKVVLQLDELKVNNLKLMV
jgi:hypothetical protein